MQQWTALAAIQLPHNLIIAPTHLYISMHYTAMDKSILRWNSQVNYGAHWGVLCYTAPRCMDWIDYQSGFPLTFSHLAAKCLVTAAFISARTWRGGKPDGCHLSKVCKCWQQLKAVDFLRAFPCHAILQILIFSSRLRAQKMVKITHWLDIWANSFVGKIAQQ